MKKTNKTWTYLLIVMGIVVIIANGCSLIGLDDPAGNDPVIVWANPADIGFGTELTDTQLDATSEVFGTFNYDPPIYTILDIGANQDLKVFLFPDDRSKYNSVGKTVKINVLDLPTEADGISVAIFNTDKTYGMLTDNDGNVYKTITIGSQTWMAENLRTTHYRNGNPIPLGGISAWQLTAAGAYNNFGYMRDKIGIATLGRLYNWYAVSDSRNIAPEGWHVPTDAEWETLRSYLGGRSVAGGKLKEATRSHWTSPTSFNVGGTNESGFTAFPASMLDDGGRFSPVGKSTFWWSSTESSPTHGSNWKLYLENTDFDSSSSPKNYGYSVRCIKD